jgi:hypothetical protein
MDQNQPENRGILLLNDKPRFLPESKPEKGLNQPANPRFEAGLRDGDEARHSVGGAAANLGRRNAPHFVWRLI